MKKMLSVLMALTMTLSLVACGSDIPSTATEAAGKPISQQQDTQAPTETTVETESVSKGEYEITECKADTWVDSIGTPWVQVIVEITNTGTTNLYLSSGSYDLEDSEGNLIDSNSLVSEYPGVIAPGEKGYMYEETILENPVEGEINVVPRVDVEEAKVDLIRYEVTDAKLSEDKYGGLKILGRVENTSSETKGIVYIVAFLYDADDSCIGQMFTILTEDLAPGDKIGFEMSGMSLPDDVTVDAVSNIVYYAYPSQMQF